MPSRVLRAVGCPPVCSQGYGVPPVLSGLWSTLLCAEGCGVPSCALRAVGCPPVLSGLWGALLCAEGCEVPSYVLSGMWGAPCALRAVGCPPVCGGATEACRSLQEVGGHLLWKRLESGCSWDKLVSPRLAPQGAPERPQGTSDVTAEA